VTYVLMAACAEQPKRMAGSRRIQVALAFKQTAVLWVSGATRGDAKLRCRSQGTGQARGA